MTDSTPRQPTKRERKDAARDERLERERLAGLAAQRRRRLVQLGGVLAAAAVVLVVAILVSSGGGSDDGAADGGEVAGAAQTRTILAGIAQDGNTLGRADAPVTLVEFVDPQCPFCKRYSEDVLPEIVDRYVKPGKVRMQLQPLSFIGEDSVRAAQVLGAAAEQNRMWNVAELMFYNQGGENSGYVTDDWLGEILGAAGGLDAERVLAAGEAAPAAKVLTDANAMAQRHGVDGTPGFLLGTTGGTLRKVELEELSVEAVSAAIDRVAAG